MKYKVGNLAFQFDEQSQTGLLITPEGNFYGANPLELWNQFVSAFDGQVRRRIGDMLEENGRNRYTGAVKPQTSIQH